jgi:hypothetical protein
MNDSVLIEDCDFEIVEHFGVKMSRVHHRPSNRCVVCADLDVTQEELFAQLRDDLDRIQKLGLNSIDTICVVTKEDPVIH